MDQIHQKKLEQNVALPCISEEQNISLQTPLKNVELIRTDKDTELPDKFKTIAELFNQMMSSLRLLGLRKEPPIFQKVSSRVEVLSKRKFLHKHLAQIKYILPEAVKIEKVLVHDKKTLCMMPDLKVTLLFDAVDVPPQKSGFVVLRELFTTRLEDFASKHPEASDVPEFILPASFHQSGKTDIHEDVAGGFMIQSQDASSEIANVLEPSITLESVHKHFSREVISPKLGNTDTPMAQSLCSSSINYQVTQNMLQKELDCPNAEKVEEDDIKKEMQDDVSTRAGQSTRAHSSLCSVACESPAVKDSSSTESILIETPAQLTPKVSIDKADSNQKPATSQKCMSDHKPAKRSLDFFSVEGDRNKSSSTLGDLESSKHVLFCRPCSTEDVAVTGISDLRLESKDKEWKGALDKDQISQENSGICQQTLSCLRGAATVIDDVFRSVGRHSITKEELVHKIIMNNFDIVERREVEEQVELLQRLVPDWICQKLTPGGDVMYSIKRVPVSGIESVLSKLVST